MIQILEFVFSSFWNWIGTVIILGLIFEGISYIIRGE